MAKNIREIHISHRSREYCYEGLIRVIEEYSTATNTYLYRYFETRHVFKIDVFDMSLFLPTMIIPSKVRAICDEIQKISKKMLKIRRRKALVNLMETTYKYAFGDEGKEVAVNTYLNMDEKRRKSKNGKELRGYLKEHALNIIRWHIKNAEPKEVYNILKLDLVSNNVLREIYPELEENMGFEVRAYFLDMIGKDKKNNITDDNNLEL